MSHCTTTPITTPVTAPVASDRRSQAQALRSTLDQAAEAINSHHAQVLAAVIEMKTSGLHRSEFGFSALRDLLLSQFDFTFNTAGSIAAIARLAGKFRLLAQAATTGKARIDQVAFAVRQLDKTPAMRLFARTPFTTPVPSPFDPETLCATPEAMVAQYCAHASFKDLQRHLDELWASIAEEAELLDELGAQSLQRLELMPQDNGMWSLSAELSDTTGRLLDKYLQTACPPPRQEDQDSDGLLPPQEHRHAEALHQLLAGYGSSPQAATRHGHTATLDLTVDIETLQGKDTGRLPLLEGDPISVPRARLLACEGVVIPSVFNYATGEAVELGRALRLPNTALRRKLELEQPGGCAWSGCGRPVAWTEAHHIQHWADGGPTIAENLILLCRFHHGRIHTTGWTVEKTGPGQAIITHHDGHHTSSIASAPDGNTGCGCSDWRTDHDMDTEHHGTDWDVFPTGLYRTEWSETMKPDLDALAEAIDRDRALKAMKAARAKCRAKFTTPNQATPTPTPPITPPIGKAPKPSEPIEAPRTQKVMAGETGEVDYGEPPFLRCPQRATAEGKRRNTKQRSPTPARVRAPRHAQGRNPPRQGPETGTAYSRRASPARHAPLCRCRPEPEPNRPRRPKNSPGSTPPRCRCPPEPEPDHAPKVEITVPTREDLFIADCLNRKRIGSRR
ncbi:HNH endonuclease signature motif containing protein [Glycomyces rhizosphaerae]|uniref:DUF222 domain-containing protein n=1 Tax=Glycomyces rhizosphaerae TaxID=2054422 RepID=A0ABV7Q377_9ACTN